MFSLEGENGSQPHVTDQPAGKPLFSLDLFFSILISTTGIRQTGRMAAKYFGLITASLAAASTTTLMVLPDFDAPTIAASIMEMSVLHSILRTKLID